MKRLTIVQPGEKIPALAGVTGDFADWIAEPMGLDAGEFQVFHPQHGEPLPPVASVQTLVITGSAAMVSDEQPWMASLEQWLRAIIGQGTPILGICFGHQFLAQTLGGVVGDNPHGVEAGTVETRLTPEAADDPLLVHNPYSLPVQVAHCQSVLMLPPGAVRLASSGCDPNHAFRYGDRIWGIQFHPELSPSMTMAYIEYYREALSNQGDDAACLLAGVHDTPFGSELLRRYARITGLV